MPSLVVWASGNEVSLLSFLCACLVLRSSRFGLVNGRCRLTISFAAAEKSAAQPAKAVETEQPAGTVTTRRTTISESLMSVNKRMRLDFGSVPSHQLVRTKTA